MAGVLIVIVIEAGSMTEGEPPPLCGQSGACEMRGTEGTTETEATTGPLPAKIEAGIGAG